MNNVIKKTDDSKPYVEEKKVSNLTSKEVKILKDIINRGKQVKNHNEQGKMITLDEAVERIKDGR
ncbi:hypothetical protein [Clostridium sp. Cult1]|uniref:hypothetical protein n=1 Tax=Clostridium sp. Cult1 TaxID=2079002 RepID=UPI001F1F6AD0|nr:hypothetical protein [Clostridium sp. Cult1]